MKTLTEVFPPKWKWLKNDHFLPDVEGSACLGYALVLRLGAQWGQAPSREQARGWADARMIRLIKAYFPERVLGLPPPAVKGPTVEFNDHPATVYEEVEKLVWLYDQEVADGVPEGGVDGL